MGLKFVVSEAQTRSTKASQASGQAQQAAAALQQSIQTFLSAPLSSKAYDSAKNYFMVAYTPICQSIIMTGEALANAHKKFLSEYQATVNGSDLDEDQLVAEIDNYKALLDTIDDLIRDAKTHRTDLERRSMNAYQAMQKRQEKLEKFREYSSQSASFFSDYQSSQNELNNGLAQVQDCKAWNASTGSFDITRLDMTWAKPINDRWEKREKMKQEELKKAEATKANTLAEHGLTEADLVQPNDPESVVLEKYIRLAQMGVNPHTGLPITDEEKWKFQYAAHGKTVFDVLGVVGGSYAGQYAAKNDFYKSSNTVKSTKTDFGAENPMSGKDWNKYFTEKYGVENVQWKTPVSSIDEIMNTPSSLFNVKPTDVADFVKREGWTVTPLKKGGNAGIPYEDGGGFSMNPSSGGMGESKYIQYHPGNGHHGEVPYYKVSQPNKPTVRIYMNGRYEID